MNELANVANQYYGYHARIVYAQESTPVVKVMNWMHNCSAAFSQLQDIKRDIPSFAKAFSEFQSEGFRIENGLLVGDLSKVREYAKARTLLPGTLTEESCKEYELGLYLMHLAELAGKLHKSTSIETESVSTQTQPVKRPSLFEMAQL